MASKEQMRYKNNKWDIKIDILISQRYSAASNSKRQVEVRYNKNFSQIEPGSVGSTKLLILIAKWIYSNSPLETLLRNLEATPLLSPNLPQYLSK